MSPPIARTPARRRGFFFCIQVAESLAAADRVTYKAEPYVVAADAYSDRPHVGRGG